MKTKKLTYIQKLELKKRKYHEARRKSKYPNGIFSIQIRYGPYGWHSKKDNVERHVGLRWGIKRSNYYYGRSFELFRAEDGKIVIRDHINNSFKYTYNYPDLDSLLRKCKRAEVDQDLVDTYIKELEKRSK